MKDARRTIAVSASILFVTALISGRAAEGPRTTSNASAVATPLRNSKSATKEKTSGATESKPLRLREGSKLVDQVGDFQKSGESGDQINFYIKDPSTVLRVLENLALERVVRVMDDNPSMRSWSVTGVITEFRGENYLLVTRATLKAHQKQTPTVEQRKVESTEKKEESSSTATAPPRPNGT